MPYSNVADYVVSMYPPPPHTIHPPHIGSSILGEFIIFVHFLFEGAS